ncbi:MAG: hypothetical protein CO187_05285 [Zetaproteobacteria bacterium CG_4_9_14_3_um_filter_53_7]|nr:MAG: hypothetical protein CO187_05285 [Zetaproteobacteria bacterium CG_4_9_14_3_um_filter_53_7]
MKILLLIIVVVGSWVSMNIYNDQKLFTNPLAEKSASDKLMNAAKNGLDASGELLQEKGSELVDQTKELAADAVEKGSELIVETKDAAVEKYNKTVGSSSPDADH